MSENEIRDSGLGVDVPFEATESKDIEYQSGESMEDALRRHHPDLFPDDDEQKQ